MRELSKKFMSDLLEKEGVLNPILTSVKKDHTLMLAIRDGFINIYYRGGSILRVTEHSKGFYRTFFDHRYNKSGYEIPSSPATIENQDDAKKWVTSFLYRKNVMDEFYSMYGKSEREYQQLVARENNNSSISNESEYFISDIEVTETAPGARFDMVAIRWLANKRKSGDNCRLAFIEMKYGDGAIHGSAGILKHLNDIDGLIANTDHYSKLVKVIENQFNQLDQLGLLNFNKGKSFAKVNLDASEKPEVIFILANHNPRASGLKTILNTSELNAYSVSSRFDLRFFVASFAGYGLHSKCMFDLTRFRELALFDLS
jgi:hypothetical protein